MIPANCKHPDILQTVYSAHEDSTRVHMKDGRIVQISGLEVFQNSTSDTTFLDWLKARLFEPRLKDYIQDVLRGRRAKKYCSEPPIVDY